MIHFEGLESFAKPPGDLFDPLTDAAWLAAAVPDATIAEANADRAVWDLKPKLNFITGSLQTTLVVSERHPHTTAVFKVTGKAVGSGSTVVTTLNFAPSPTGTDIRWTGEITELNGLLKMVPKPLIQAAAQKVIADLWAAIRAKLSS
jgi:carbon monoxide dehydrogenase subunit G